MVHAHSLSPERPGVLLVAHGSARSAASAEPILALADQLRARGFEEVRTAFWKEEPFLHQALDTLRSSRVAVLPVFLAEGYFSRTVAPRELGLSYGSNLRDGRTVRLLPPLATAPGLADLVLARAREAIGPGATTSQTALVVMGHGTPRDPGSAQAVLDVCARLRGESGFGRVEPAFIDQDPRVEDVVAGATEPIVVVVPFLVAEGWHGGTTAPTELGIDGRTGSAPRAGGTTVHYAEPVGTHAGMVDLVDEMLRAAGAAVAPRSDGGATSPTPRDSDASTPLARAERALVDLLGERGTARMLEAQIRTVQGAGWELRHVDDADAQPQELAPVSDAPALERLARRTASGGQRPLRTAADLPRGWRFAARTPRELGDGLVALYGAALVHWHAGQRGALAATSFRTTAARQTGIYERLAQVEPAAVQAGIARVCDGCPCLRQRMWTVEAVSVAAGRAKGAGGTLDVPCPAPCPVLLTTVLELSGDPALERETE